MRIPALLTVGLFSCASAFAADIGEAAWHEKQRAAVVAIAHDDCAAGADLAFAALDLAETRMQRGLSEASAGVALFQLGRMPEASRILERGLVDLRGVPGVGGGRDTAAAALGAARHALGDYSGAEKALTDALAEESDNPGTRAAVLNDLADLQREQNRMAEARALYERALATPDIEWRRRAQSLAGLAEVEVHDGNVSLSLDRWNEALTAARDHDSVEVEASIQRGMGETWMLAGNPGRAEPLLKRALWLAETAEGVSTANRALTLTCLGTLYTETGRYAMAEDSLEKAIQIAETYMAPDHPQMVPLYTTMAMTRSLRGDAEGARAYVRRARAIVEGRLDRNESTLAGIMAFEADVEYRAGNSGKALSIYQQAYSIATGPDNFTDNALRRSILNRYTTALKAAHRGSEAKALLAGAAAFRQ